MTIYYLDFVNGNDANTGLSWAQAKKTFNTGIPTSLTAPGDEIRVAKSPDPVLIGNATWTNDKTGNSITFASAPTKFLSSCESGWLQRTTATVTNNQSTAFIAGTGGLQIATSSINDLAYTGLGGTQDLSGYQQISFWFRCTTSFDCTGTQNMYIDLCSDAIGATAVNHLAMPKYNYAANTWYPIVINNAAPLGSNIVSMSIKTSNVVTATFFYDEFFVSPANGITLESTISPSNEVITTETYPIQTVRDADVWLLPTYSPTTAARADAASNTNAPWYGITGTYATYVRNGMIKAFATSPTGNVFTIGEAGSSTTYNLITGGWDTTSNTQTGETWFDGVNQTMIGFASTSFNYWEYRNFGFIRFNIVVNNNSNTLLRWNQISMVASVGTAMNNIGNSHITGYTWTLGALTGNTNAAQLTTWTSGTGEPVNFNVGTIWCNGNGTSVSTGFPGTMNIKKWAGGRVTSGVYVGNIGSAKDLTVNIDFLSTSSKNTNSAYPALSITNCFNTHVIIKDCYATWPSASTWQNIVVYGTSCGNQITFINPPTIANNQLISLGDVYGSQPMVGDCVVNNLYAADGNILKSAAILGNDGTISFNNLNGTGARIVKGSFISTAFGVDRYYELQSTDVNTPGSKAWKYKTGATADNVYAGNYQTVNLASVACVANKLVTVTCYVKRSSAAATVGIIMPGGKYLVPGYTTDQIATVTTTNAYEQLTLTFTPTADCVFDIGTYYHTSGTAITFDAVWDDLVITQAA